MKMTYNTIFFMIILVYCLSIISCTNVKYDEPQPISALNSIEIPEHLHGQYQKDEMSNIYIYNDGIIVDLEETSLYKTKYKTDSNLVLFKSMHGLYANLLDSTGLWDCFLITYNDTSMTIFSSDVNEILSDSTQWLKNNNLINGVVYRFSDDSSQVIINNIDYFNLYRSFNKSNFKKLELIKQ